MPAIMSSKPSKAVIGGFQPNGFGHHVIAGNVSEWDWNFNDPTHGTTVSV
jgi:formylglycine-generating enzyme required for sulfatase activity